ncbi:hypothetical protein Bca52824_096330, partial [Brassica carinata]
MSHQGLVKEGAEHFQMMSSQFYLSPNNEEEMKKGELEADTDKLMREYRAQLDAERALKLSRGGTIL